MVLGFSLKETNDRKGGIAVLGVVVTLQIPSSLGVAEKIRKDPKSKGQAI
jgi:hypothetical protein